MFTLQFNPDAGIDAQQRVSYTTQHFCETFQDGAKSESFKAFKRKVKEGGITWKQACESVQTDSTFADFLGPLWLGTVQNATLSGGTIANAPFVNSYTAGQGPSDQIRYRLYRRYHGLTIDAGDSDIEFETHDGSTEVRHVTPLITGDAFSISQQSIQDLPIEQERLNLESVSTMFPLTYQMQIIDGLYTASSGQDAIDFENVGVLGMDNLGRVPFSEILREKLTMELPDAINFPLLANNPTQLAAYQRLFVPTYFLASPKVYKDICQSTLLQASGFFRNSTLLDNGSITGLFNLTIIPIPTGYFGEKFSWVSSDDCYLISPLAGIDLVFRQGQTVDSWIINKNRRLNWQVYSRQGSFVRVPSGIRRLVVSDEYGPPVATDALPVDVLSISTP